MALPFPSYLAWGGGGQYCTEVHVCETSYGEWAGKERAKMEKGPASGPFVGLDLVNTAGDADGFTGEVLGVGRS